MWVVAAFILMSVATWEINRILELRINDSDQSRVFGLQIPAILTRFIGSLLPVAIVNYLIIYTIAALVLNVDEQTLKISGILAITFAFRINLFLNTINLIFYLFNKVKETELETEKLRQARLEEEVKSLKDQMNPHFLFNNLNVLSALLIKNSDKANTFLEKFAEVYRYILNKKDKEWVTIQEELELLDAYLFLLEQRFPNALELEVKLGSDLKMAKIIPGTFQLLLENVVKHNCIGAGKPVHVKIDCTDRKKITFQNTLLPKDVHSIEPNGIGLKLISRRYQLLTKESVKISQNNQVFEVELPLID